MLGMLAGILLQDSTVFGLRRCIVSFDYCVELGRLTITNLVFD